MTRDVLKTLFHPFDTGDLDAPGEGPRFLFLGAEPGFVLPSDFRATLSMVQGFRPFYLALQKSGHQVSATQEGSGFAGALVLCGRHRGQNEARLCAALGSVQPGGLIVVAGGKEDGIASLCKRVGDMTPLDGKLPKHHGLAFWLKRPADVSALIDALRSEVEAPLVDGRFRTEAGMFSHDRIDAGSRLLVANFPTDIYGAVADFCSGWGYLALEMAQRFSKIKKLDLYEADHASLAAARTNLEGAVGELPVQYLWQDLLTEPVARQYDFIAMNPPFHRSRAAEPEIGQGMIRAAAAALKPGGRLLMVANRQLPYEATLTATFAAHRELARDGMFKIFIARR